MGFKHKVELADIRKVAFAAAGAGDSVLTDKSNHIFICHGFHIGHGIAGLMAPIFDKLVRAVAHFTGFTVDERVVEGRDVSGSHPYLWIHQNGRVQSDIMRIFLDKFFPPRFFNIVFQFHAKRTIIPGVCKPAVNFGAGVYKAAAFAERDDLIHCFVSVFHGFKAFLPNC